MTHKAHFLCLLILAAGCGRPGKVERRIGERIDSCKRAAPCTVNIADLTDFRWDTMHVFTPGVSPAEIDHALGRRLFLHPDLEGLLVFQLRGSIVYREFEPYDPELPIDGEVSFASMKRSSFGHWSFTPRTAVFFGHRETIDGRRYYVLDPPGRKDAQ